MGVAMNKQIKQYDLERYIERGENEASEKYRLLSLEETNMYEAALSCLNDSNIPAQRKTILRSILEFYEPHIEIHDQYHLLCCQAADLMEDLK